MVMVYICSLTPALERVYYYDNDIAMRYDNGIVKSLFSSDSQGRRRTPGFVCPTGAGRSQGGKVVCQLLSEDRVAMTGVIFDPTQNDVHEELRIEIGKRNLEVVLDPKIMELASLGGFSGQRTNLPWAGERRHVPADLRGRSADAVADAIAQFVALHGYSAVLAPSHYLENGAEGQWCDVDSQLTIKLRDRLDKAGCKEVAIFYPFATSTKFFYAAQRRKLKDVLCNLPIDQLWLRNPVVRQQQWTPYTPALHRSLSRPSRASVSIDRREDRKHRTGAACLRCRGRY